MNNNNIINFGKYDRIILFGGGILLLEFAKKIASEKIDLYVVTSERHSKEKIQNYNNQNLESILKKNFIKFIKCKNINLDPRIKKIITHNSISISISAPWIFQKKLLIYLVIDY